MSLERPVVPWASCVIELDIARLHELAQFPLGRPQADAEMPLDPPTGQFL